MGAEQSQMDGVNPDWKSKKVSFHINGQKYTASPDKLPNGAESLLIDYIRDEAGLKGTKFMCREGGCGACLVTVKLQNPVSGKQETRAVNSCLIPVYRCDGLEITTIESLGSVKTGLHPIQDRMVKFSGTQCGFCTPGWIMNMHGLMESSDRLEAKDIEDSMDGNICRCTGYRPILDAMKSFAADASEELKRKCTTYGVDLTSCDRSGGCCRDQQSKLQQDPQVEQAEEATEDTNFDECLEATPFHLEFASGQQWVRATDMNSLFAAIQAFKSAKLKYRIVAGNTGSGVFKNDGPYQAFVEVNSIPELTGVVINPQQLTIGGGVTITCAIQALKKASEMDGFSYCREICKHWSRVANTAVRNNGTLAGNLMLKHTHREFPSDIFLVLETVGAKLSIASAPGQQRQMSLMDFLAMDMTGSVITAISFAKLKNRFIRTFKITRRYQNAHAYVNAGFMMKVDPNRKFSVREKPTIVFGGIAPNFVHASATEMLFLGRFLDERTIQNAISSLGQELKPDHRLPDADPMYRKKLAQALLYKFCLGILADAASPLMQSGSTDIERGLSYGKQAYDTDKSDWPLREPIPKIEAKIQCTGEAEYTNDIPASEGQVHGAFVTSKVGNAEIAEVDTSEALEVSGVVAYIDAKDIPGANNYMTMWDAHQPDPIFANIKILYAGQPIGMVVAKTREIAISAAKLVRVKYINVQKPVLDIPTSLEIAKVQNRLEDCTLKVVDNFEEGQTLLPTAQHTVKGKFAVGAQFHLAMESHVTVCVPREDQMEVYCAHQFPTQLQAAVSASLAIPANSVLVQVRRLGGAFGAKISRATQIAAACAVAAYKLKRPVRMVFDGEQHMSTMGKRLPYLFDYEVGFDDTGKITNLDAKFYCDTGISANENTAPIAFLTFQTCYKADNWKVAPGNVITNTAPNTYCRSPGSPQAIACMETIMDHIAFKLKKDGLDVRSANYWKQGDGIFGAPEAKFLMDNQVPMLLPELFASADIPDRTKFIVNFNKTNRWKKRGLGVQPMRYPIHYFFSGFNIFLSVYGLDGTVSLTHSGIEMGQGINTKVVQVVASCLCIPVDKINVKPVTSLTSANTAVTGGSTTSEHVCYSAMKACKILLDRLEPVKTKLGGDPKWELLVATANKEGLDLTAYYNTTYADKLQAYDVWGVAATEVEIDVLTGEYKIVRADLINDAGQSLSPEVDIGQTEGSFIMGLGLWLTEKIQYDQESGQVLTNNTWEYKPPLAKDIPQDFRVTLMKNSSNPFGVLKSKATGEAPFCLSYSVLMAMRQAIVAARSDAGNSEWFELNAPLTVEDIQRLCLTSPEQFRI